MPQIKFNPPDVANLASKLPRPLQYPVGAALGGLMSVFGGNDPQSIMPGPSGIEAPMISIYKDAAGIPSAALREGGTQEFLKSAGELGSEGLQNAAQIFAERYPRVAAHMRIDPSIQATSAYRAATHVPPFEPEAPIKVSLSNVGLHSADTVPSSAVDTMFHEGTHVAQALGNRHTDLLYRLGLKLPGGYAQHPMEESARAAASYATGALPTKIPASALRGLRNAAQTTLTGPTSNPLEMRRAAKNILDIINTRTGK